MFLGSRDRRGYPLGRARHPSKGATRVMSRRHSIGIYFTPAGAAMAIVCFFLPWARVSCAPGVRKSLSGAQLGGPFWLVFAAAVIVLAAFLLFHARRRLEWARPIILLASLAALAVIVIKSIEYAHGRPTPVGSIKPDPGLQTKLGGAGTLIGFALAIAGTGCIRERPSAGRPRVASRRAARSTIHRDSPSGGPSSP